LIVLWFRNENVRDVAVELAKVQPVSHQESIGHLKTYVVDGNLDLTVGWFV
jgi:hypothetical protein